MCACSIKPLIRVVSLDVTGTLLDFAHPIGVIYHQCAVRTLANPPTAEELDASFRIAFKQAMKSDPCYGLRSHISEREWWSRVVRQSLTITGRDYPDHQFQGYFRQVMQAFGSPESFIIYDDTVPLLSFLRKQQLMVGILTNSSHRTVEATLPMLGLHKQLDWFVCSQDVCFEKPHRLCFDHTFEILRRQMPALRREEILHVGDNYEEDYIGARNAGWRALFLGTTSTLSRPYSRIIANSILLCSQTGIPIAATRIVSDQRWISTPYLPWPTLKPF
jgi:REG-2-like HAD superfamily hydrolase